MLTEYQKANNECEPIVIQDLLSYLYKEPLNFNCNFKMPSFLFRDANQNYSLSMPAKYAEICSRHTNLLSTRQKFNC
jgi:hypothetical protein